MGAYFIYLFILRATVEKYFFSANAEMQLDFPLGNCNMEDWDFGLSFANNTVQMLSFKDRSHLSEDKQQTRAGTSLIIYFSAAHFKHILLYVLCKKPMSL